MQAKAFLAYKTYGSDKIVPAAQVQGLEVIIPSKTKRKQPRALDKHRYKAPHLIESLFQRMKVFCRFATRSDKLDVMFLGIVPMASIMKCLH